MIDARSSGDVRPKPSLDERCVDCPADPSHVCPGMRARRLCNLVDPAHAAHRPDYRETVRSMAAQVSTVPMPTVPEWIARKKPDPFPPATQQAANLAAAVGRVVSAAVRGEPVRVEPAEYERRLAICRPCEHNGAAPPGVRCKLCGCGGAKLGLATERCPAGKWEKQP